MLSPFPAEPLGWCLEPSRELLSLLLVGPRDMHRMGGSPGMPHLCHQQTACIREHLARCQALFSK